MNLKILFHIVLLAVLTIFSSCSSVTVETADNFEMVELPDGSMAYLNHNSRLTYDSSFNPSIIGLKGEVFLSATKGDTPFIVQTGLCEIKVLGTEFNVKSDKNEISVEVKKGRVQLETEQTNVKIESGERAVYKKNESKIKKWEAEYDFEVWLNRLKVEFRKLGKEIKHESRQIGKESKKVGREFKKEIKN